MRADYYCPDCGAEKKDHPTTRAYGEAPLCYCTGEGREMTPNAPDDGVASGLYDEKQGTEDG